MLAKTHGVRLLAAEILGTLSPPYSEDIIEEVFLAIESHSGWMQRYQDLEADLTHNVVNNWIGRYVKEIASMETIREVSARRSRLIKDYSKLRY